MSRKKLAALAALGLSAVLALAGCSGQSGSNDTASTQKTAKAGGFIQIVVNDPSNPYWLTEGNVAQAEAEKLGYTASVAASKGDVNTESTIIDTAIAKHAVGIILDPANADGSIGNIKRAMAKDIPVFLVNAEINEQGVALGQLVSNNAQGAALGAQQWIKAAGTKGQYAELFGLPSDNNAATRSNGYKTVISQYPDWKKVAQQTANWDRAQGQQKMQSILQAHPDINAVISGNDEMALGAIAAIKQAGKKLSVDGTGDGIVVGGFDGSPDAIDAIKAGELAYTVLQPVATFAKEAVQQLDTYIRTGEKPAQEKQSFDCILITKDNVDKMTGPFTYGG
ncbi:D-ribose ABC transporter substrate-binding protein [Microbacterium sp. KR10-403]|uniref:D-ribose ABC transporter substrate-binding protein n=1 Tax=Microbacterium sp. KR10-403 TaxID=3158581 RepID=UPI0032E3BB5F